MDKTGEPYELIFVNEGSRDQSATMIKRYGDQDYSVKLISFSRNFSHQLAITAGIDYASGAAFFRVFTASVIAGWNLVIVIRNL